MNPITPAEGEDCGENDCPGWDDCEDPICLMTTTELAQLVISAALDDENDR